MAIEWTGRVAVLVYCCLGAIALGIVVALLVAAPAMRNACILFPEECGELKVRRGKGPSSGQLFVSDPRTGRSYWFDGVYVHAYGDNLPGVCPGVLASGATGKLSPVADKVGSPCVRVAPDGTCAAYGASATPAVFDGVVGARGSGAFETSFLVDASTMSVVAPDRPVHCSKPVGQVELAFAGTPESSVRYRVPEDEAVLDVYQAFALLEKKGIFKRPRT